MNNTVQEDSVIADNSTSQETEIAFLKEALTEPVAEEEQHTEAVTSTATANDLVIKEIELKDTIDLLISDAVKEVLPAIEKQLTEELSKQIYQQLFSELSKDN